jgi:hypothetical protein
VTTTDIDNYEDDGDEKKVPNDNGGRLGLQVCFFYSLFPFSSLTDNLFRQDGPLHQNHHVHRFKLKLHSPGLKPLTPGLKPQAKGERVGLNNDTVSFGMFFLTFLYVSFY